MLCACSEIYFSSAHRSSIADPFCTRPVRKKILGWKRACILYRMYITLHFPRFPLNRWTQAPLQAEYETFTPWYTCICTWVLQALCTLRRHPNVCIFFTLKNILTFKVLQSESIIIVSLPRRGLSTKVMLDFLNSTDLSQ